MGSSVSKAALGATTDEPTEPEARHLADLTQYINQTNMSVKHLANILSEKTGSSSWVVVFKALVTVHHLMVHGNEANPDELTNGIIHAAFLLLFKDSLRLFAAYNEGILNLLDKYFNMRRSQCKESLDLYIKFLGRTTKLTQFLKVAECYENQMSSNESNSCYCAEQLVSGAPSPCGYECGLNCRWQCSRGGQGQYPNVDLEAQTAIVTESQALQQQLHLEQKQFYLHSSVVSSAIFEPPNWQVKLWGRW
ncbi:Phosphatidylinositol-binding clathrin assembly protein [Fukomys damarensis]|uniref:Phosphatidylinositol-binding clathrin assembly protein n=1 Tax=Fukomys damarensis TaxID=885580 RepID=A0A091DP41_FUKDA|nr:Phosphatidylinositol-binding clathrin assembly protein [Fukomys damarensis]